MFFIKKPLQHKCFPVKFLRTSFSTEQLRWLLFKISNSNKSVQRCFSDISYAQPMSDNLQLPQWQTNLKMHSLITKNLFQQSIFVTGLDPTPPLSELWSIKRPKFFLLSLKELLPFLSKVRHSTLTDRLIFEDQQLWLVRSKLT